MMIAWIGYCLLVSALLGLAALAGERALTHYRQPVRWVWLGAVAGSVLLPLAAFVAPALVARLAPVEIGLPALGGALPPLELAVDATAADGPAAGSVVAAFGGLLGWLWVASIVLLGGSLAGTYRRLKSEMREWTAGEILDSPVMLSRDRGPAVVGIRRAVIVMPRWIADLEDDLLRLVFLHEREHQRAGDHRAFAAGLAAVVLMPWNPVLWWQLTRLRLAIEYDCDRRVMARGASPRRYAEALLAVGDHLGSPHLAAAAFAEPRPAVERRLRRLTEPLRRLRGPRAAIAAGLGTLALAFACGSPLPTSPGADAADPRADVAPAPDEAVADAPDPSERPMFIPYDRPPQLTNGDEVRRVLQDAYPGDLKDGGVGGRVELWLYIDETGSVLRHQVKTSSGHPRLDAAAAEVVQSMRFTPAVNRDQPTPVWVSQWITFQIVAGPDAPGDGSSLAAGDAASAREAGTPSAGGETRVVTAEGSRPSAPLIVLDGVIQAADFDVSSLKATDIDHIDIWKGAEARARYGPRGDQGVIHITTKAHAGG